MMQYREEREAIVQHCRMMLAGGLTTGAGGNISVRLVEDAFAISPTGIAYDAMQSTDICVVNGQANVIDGSRLPSSELPMHLAIYQARSDVHAVVHTHSPYATTFACLRESIPPVHYLVGFAGTHVPLAEYATYGTEALAENAIRALGREFNAVLLANHGLLALGTSIERAFATAEEIELVARIAFQARAIGSPALLDDTEMQRVIEKFRTYGLQPEGKEE